MKIRWVQFIGIASCLLSVLWLIGFGLAFTNYFNKETTTATQLKVSDHGGKDVVDETVQKYSETSFLVVALGDSLTVGTGDAEGKGYVGNVIDSLEQRGIEDIPLLNFGVNGLTSQGLLEMVKQPEVAKQIEEAKLILLTIGGNDLFQSGETLLTLDREEIQILEQGYLDNIRQIFTQLRSLNKTAPIYSSGLYNPFIEFTQSQLTSEIVIDWNYKTALEIEKYPNAVFVPTYDLFQLNVNDYLADDRFHPNKSGYEQIAQRIVSLLAWVGDQES